MAYYNVHYDDDWCTWCPKKVCTPHFCPYLTTQLVYKHSPIMHDVSFLNLARLCQSISCLFGAVAHVYTKMWRAHFFWDTLYYDNIPVHYDDDWYACIMHTLWRWLVYYDNLIHDNIILPCIVTDIMCIINVTISRKHLMWNWNLLNIMMIRIQTTWNRTSTCL